MPRPTLEPVRGGHTAPFDLYPLRGESDTPFARVEFITTMNLPETSDEAYVLERNYRNPYDYTVPPYFALDATSERAETNIDGCTIVNAVQEFVTRLFESRLLTATVYHLNEWELHGNHYITPNGVQQRRDWENYNHCYTSIHSLFKCRSSYDDVYIALARIAAQLYNSNAERIRQLLYALAEGDIDDITPDHIMNYVIPQCVGNSEESPIFWRSVLQGEMFSHSADVVTHLCTEAPPKRALGIEMELELADTSSEVTETCISCDGSGNITEYCAEGDNCPIGGFDEDCPGHESQCYRCEGSGEVTRYEDGESVNRRAALRNIALGMPERSYLPKYDGSLDDTGVEFVSVPMLRMQAYEWLDKLCDLASASGFAGTENCGMHIHLSRGWFSGKAHIARFYGLAHGPLRGLIELYVGDDRRAALREWAHVDDAMWRRIIWDGEVCGGHYDGVSLDGEHTIEVRFFAGTTDKDEAKANIELMLAMIEFSSNGGACSPWPKAGVSATVIKQKFLSWVLLERKKDYKFLAERLLNHTCAPLRDDAHFVTQEQREKQARIRAAKKAKKQAQMKEEAICA